MWPPWKVVWQFLVENLQVWPPSWEPVLQNNHLKFVPFYSPFSLVVQSMDRECTPVSEHSCWEHCCQGTQCFRLMEMARLSLAWNRDVGHLCRRYFTWPQPFCMCVCISSLSTATCPKLCRLWQPLLPQEVKKNKTKQTKKTPMFL